MIREGGGPWTPLLVARCQTLHGQVGEGAGLGAELLPVIAGIESQSWFTLHCHTLLTGLFVSR